MANRTTVLLFLWIPMVLVVAGGALRRMISYPPQVGLLLVLVAIFLLGLVAGRTITRASLLRSSFAGGILGAFPGLPIAIWLSWPRDSAIGYAIGIGSSAALPRTIVLASVIVLCLVTAGLASCVVALLGRELDARLRRRGRTNG